MNNEQRQSRERRAARNTEAAVRRKKTAGTRGGSQYTPFQRVIMALSFLLILTTITASSIYIINRNRDVKPDKNKTDVIVPDKDPKEGGPKEDENWDGVSLKKTEDAGQDYIDDTLFIGDSNFRRLENYSVVTGHNVIGLTGLGIQGVFYAEGVYLSGYDYPVTPLKAIEIIEPRRVLLNFGTNNLGGYTENFISVYRDVIESIRDSYEYTDIIVMSVPPLARDVDTGYAKLYMSDVDEFNSALKEMCREMGVPFLNVTDDCLKDPDTGYAKSEIMYSDGIHIEGNGLRDLIDYYRTHAYVTEDRRPSGGTGITVREIYLPEPEPETVDCDEILSAVRSKLRSGGYSLVSSDDDRMGSEATYSYTIDSSADPDRQDEITDEAYSFICSVCSTDSRLDLYLDDNVIYITEYQPCVEHSFGSWTVAKIPTCSEEGRDERRCEVCGYKEERSVPKDPDTHTYDWTVTEEATCSAPGEEEGVCSGCGHETTREIPKTEHDPQVTQEGISPTCTESGWSEEVICSVCGEVIEAREELAALGHDYTSEVETEPTEDTPGVRRYTCSRCGDTYTEEIEATGSEE